MEKESNQEHTNAQLATFYDWLHTINDHLKRIDTRLRLLERGQR